MNSPEAFANAIADNAAAYTSDAIPFADFNARALALWRQAEAAGFERETCALVRAKIDKAREAIAAARA